MSLNIADFNLLCDKCTHPPPPIHLKKVTPSFPATPCKSWRPVKPPFFKIWLEAQPPSPTTCRRGGGGGTLCNFDWDWQTEAWVVNKVITYNTPTTLEFESCPVFPLWPESFIEVWLTDRQAGETGRPKGKHVGGSNTFEPSYI